MTHPPSVSPKLIPYFWVERAKPRSRAFNVHIWEDGEERLLNEGPANRETAIWFARLLARRRGGYVLTDEEMHAREHVCAWEALGCSILFWWSDDDYHWRPDIPEDDPARELQIQRDALERSYTALRYRLHPHVVSYLLKRQRDPKPDASTLELSELLRTVHLNEAFATEIAAIFPPEIRTAFVAATARFVERHIDSPDRAREMANYLLLASACVLAPPEPHLKIVGGRS